LFVHKYFTLLFLPLFLISTESHAAIYKGQSIFIKKCMPCHKPGETFVAKYKKSEWEKFLKSKAKPLATLHLKDQKAKKSWDYFKSKKYMKESKHLRDFLFEYAKDSGKIPLF